MLAPVCVIVGTRAITFVPYGTVTAMVCVDSVITPVAAGEAKLNAVIALAVFVATVTVTTYAWVEPSAAVTV
jgi:hypothetical protein